MKLFSLKDIQFNSILGAFQSYIESLGGKMNRTSVFGQLLTALSGMFHNAMLYIEDSLTEQNKYTAQRKKSILGLAANTGYTPSYGRSAGAWVRISHIPHNETSGDVVIRNHERLVCSSNGMYYVVILDGGSKVISQTGQLVDDHIYVTQGHFERQRFVSTGGKNYSINFKFLGYVDIQYLNVSVNGVPYERGESLYDLNAGGKQYYIRYNMVQGLDICFGNDTHGDSLSNGDVIEVEYLSHDGESGNISPKSDTIFVFAEPLQDIHGEEVDGNAMFKVQLIDNHAVVSGSNTETIEDLREMIGYNSRSLVLADPNNFKHFLNQYSFVGYNRTWSDHQSLHIKSMIMKDFKSSLDQASDYFDLRESDFFLTPIQKESIRNSLIQSQKLIAGCTYEILDMTLAKYAIFIYVKMKDDSVASQLVSHQIRSLVGQLFTDLKSDRYIPKSDIVRLIQSIDGVDGVDVSFVSEKNERAKQNKYYEVGGYRYKVTHDPGLGFDDYGNILTSEEEFPVLMGGWRMKDSDEAGRDTYFTVEPISIYFV